MGKRCPGGIAVGLPTPVRGQDRLKPAARRREENGWVASVRPAKAGGKHWSAEADRLEIRSHSAWPSHRPRTKHFVQLFQSWMDMWVFSVGGAALAHGYDLSALRTEKVAACRP